MWGKQKQKFRASLDDVKQNGAGSWKNWKNWSLAVNVTLEVYLNMCLCHFQNQLANKLTTVKLFFIDITLNVLSFSGLSPPTVNFAVKFLELVL